jgi:homoserine O-acetyltransferase
MKKVLALVFSVCVAATAHGQDTLRYAALGDLPLTNGGTLRDCRVGYRTMGKLNKDRSNAILFPSWFGGVSQHLVVHTAPGGIADSTRYFVVLVDALGNGVSTSPSNSRQQPFPQLSIRDMVNSQYQLVTQHLKLDRLFAVMGVSMGGMQALQWLVSYPSFVRKVVSMVGTPRQTAYDLLLWNTQLEAIEQVRRQGLDAQAAMPVVNMIHTLHLYTPQNRAAKVENAAEYVANAKKMRTHPDADDWAAQLQAMIGHDIYRECNTDPAGVAAIARAQTLVVVATQDQMVNPAPSVALARHLKARLVELTGDCGHLATGCEGKKMNEAVRIFLQEGQGVK